MLQCRTSVSTEECGEGRLGTKEHCRAGATFKCQISVRKQDLTVCAS